MANDIKYDRILLSIATGQICQSLGWHGIHKTPHNILTDVLERYINDLARTVIGCSLNGKLFVLFEPRFRRCGDGVKSHLSFFIHFGLRVYPTGSLVINLIQGLRRCGEEGSGVQQNM